MEQKSKRKHGLFTTICKMVGIPLGHHNRTVQDWNSNLSRSALLADEEARRALMIHESIGVTEDSVICFIMIDGDCDVGNKVYDACDQCLRTELGFQHLRGEGSPIYEHARIYTYEGTEVSLEYWQEDGDIFLKLNGTDDHIPAWFVHTARRLVTFFPPESPSTP